MHEERVTVHADEARRKIAALTAIVQTMMHHVYAGFAAKSGRPVFDLQLEDDEVLAMAIANELDQAALTHAFGWAEAAFGSLNDELSSTPVTPHLGEDQRTRARVALLALEEMDHAHTLAVRAPPRPGVATLSEEERIALGEETFLGRLEIDVLHAHAGWSGFTTMAEGPTRTNGSIACPSLGASTRRNACLSCVHGSGRRSSAGARSTAHEGAATPGHVRTSPRVIASEPVRGARVRAKGRAGAQYASASRESARAPACGWPCHPPWNRGAELRDERVSPGRAHAYPEAGQRVVPQDVALALRRRFGDGARGEPCLVQRHAARA